MEFKVHPILPYYLSAFLENTDTLPRKKSSAPPKLVSSITSFAILTMKHSSQLLITAPSRTRLISRVKILI